MRFSIAAAILTFMACTGCSGKAQGPRTVKLEDYYPLKPGASWTYRLISYEEKEKGDPSVLRSKVVSAEGGEYAVSQGQAVIRYSFDQSGLLRKGSGTYAFKAPISKGASWDVWPTDLKARRA